MTEEEFDDYMAQVTLRFDECARVNWWRGAVFGGLLTGGLFLGGVLAVWFWG